MGTSTNFSGSICGFASGSFVLRGMFATLKEFVTKKPLTYKPLTRETF
jgi:hypothetical protein